MSASISPRGPPLALTWNFSELIGPTTLVPLVGDIFFAPTLARCQVPSSRGRCLLFLLRLGTAVEAVDLSFSFTLSLRFGPPPTFSPFASSPTGGCHTKLHPTPIRLCFPVLWDFLFTLFFPHFSLWAGTLKGSVCLSFSHLCPTIFLESSLFLVLPVIVAFFVLFLERIPPSYEKTASSSFLLGHV